MNHSAYHAVRPTEQTLPARARWSQDLLAVVLGSALFFFLFLGSRPLNNPDEGRYSEIPREMIASHDYVTPRLDGVKYFEKPPLLYWISAASFQAFGFHEWTARLGAALFATLGTLLVFLAARENFGREAALWSTAILATSLLYYGLSRVALLDLPVGVLMATALFAFQIAIGLPPASKQKRRILFWTVYVAMGLAVLTKGLIGFLLPGLVMAVWVTLLNQWKNLRPFYPLSGTALLLLIAVPWHILAARANPDFLHFYFIHEQFERFATNGHDRFQPWWYFLPVLLVGLFPWTTFLYPAIRQPLEGGWAQRKQNAASWFLLLWVVLVMAFFSKSQSKLIPYIAPIFPALAVLIGQYLADSFRRQRTRAVQIALNCSAGLSAVLGLVLLFGRFRLKPVEMADALAPWRIALGVIFVASAALLFLLTHRKRFRTALLVLIGTTAAFNCSINSIASIADTRSTKSLALVLKSRLLPSDSVYCLSNYSQDFPVYLDRLVDAVDFEGELEFGIHAEPARTAARFIDRSAFLARWEGKETAYALVSRHDLPRYFSQPLAPSAFVAQNSRYVVITNQRP